MDLANKAAKWCSWFWCFHTLGAHIPHELFPRGRTTHTALYSFPHPFTVAEGWSRVWGCCPFREQARSDSITKQHVSQQLIAVRAIRLRLEGRELRMLELLGNEQRGLAYQISPAPATGSWGAQLCFFLVYGVPSASSQVYSNCFNYWPTACFHTPASAAE